MFDDVVQIFCDGKYRLLVQAVLRMHMYLINAILPPKLSAKNAIQQPSLILMQPSLH